MRCLVFNGWAAGPEAWALCTFSRDWLFSYVEQLDGLPEKVMEEFDEVLLVGFSMGSQTALKMLLKYPEKVRGLVLVSATPRMMEERRTNERTGTEEIVWKGMSERRLAALRLGTQLAFRDDPSPMYDVADMERGLAWLRTTDLRSELLKRTGRGAGDGKRMPKIPVAIFQSERDGIVRPNNAEFLKTVFPDARLTLVPGNEHVLPVTVPELIDAAVADVRDRCLRLA